MAITKEVTAKVADLIKIKIPEAELDKYTDKLQHALDPAKELKELDTANVEVLSHPTGLTSTGVGDEVKPSLSAQDILANAEPNGRAMLGYIKVPKVINN